MEAKAIANTVRITPRKARLVVDLIRNKDVAEAKAILKPSELKVRVFPLLPPLRRIWQFPFLLIWVFPESQRLYRLPLMSGPSGR